MQQWIKKILKDTPGLEGGSRKKAKERLYYYYHYYYYYIESLFIIMDIFSFIRSKSLLRQCRQSLHL